jgi:hypothetical protein
MRGAVASAFADRPVWLYPDLAQRVLNTAPLQPQQGGDGVAAGKAAPQRTGQVAALEAVISALAYRFAQGAEYEPAAAAPLRLLRCLVVAPGSSWTP